MSDEQAQKPTGFNFGGVKEASEKRMTRPGVIGLFKITEVTFDVTKNTGTYYAQVTFDRGEDSFNHSFFLTEKAAGRFKSLLKAATGKDIEENLVEEQMTKMLVGKEIALKVIGKVDEKTGKGYPDLSYGGFAKPAEEIDFLSFVSDDQQKVDEALAAINRSSTQKPDDEGAASSGSVERKRF